MSNTVTPLSEIGLFGLIEHIEKTFPNKRNNTLCGIMNDASIIGTEGDELITSHNLMLEGIHFDLTYYPLRHLGYKAVVAGISDVIASGTVPTHINLGLGLSNKMSLEAVDLLMEGVAMACLKYELDLTGFHPSSSLTGLTISTSAFGFAPKEKTINRSGAKENNLICVTGDLGAAFMGLQLLEREKQIMRETGQNDPDFTGYDYLLERQLKPEARIELLSQLQEAALTPTSMSLVREGLAAALLRLCKASGTGCNIYENKVPIDHATSTLSEEMEINPLVAALNGGEDYEMLFTLSLEDYQKIEKEGKGLKNVFVIGHITSKSKGYILETNAGEEIELKARGWGDEKNKN